MSDGWHDDPFGRYAKRYHDGTSWTGYVSNGGVTEEDPLGADPPPPGWVPPAPPLRGGYATEVEYGSPFLRLIARFLDGLIVGVPLFLVGDAILGITDDWVIDMEAEIVETPIPIEFYLLWYLVLAAYEILLIGARGRTIGKAICGLTVVRAEEPVLPGYSRAAIRWAVPLLYSLPFLPALGVALLIASAVMVFVTPTRQTVHDKAAGTVVVKSSSLSG
jgi:uncharacterized RDD family membrane protein YckC